MVDVVFTISEDGSPAPNLVFSEGDLYPDPRSDFEKFKDDPLEFFIRELDPRGRLLSGAIEKAERLNDLPAHAGGIGDVFLEVLQDDIVCDCTVRS